MARKATDLLDVFRFGGDSEAEDQRRAASKPKARAERAKAKAESRERGFDGLILSKRQLLLTGSAMMLLLVLSFVIGLSAGRPGAPTPAARRDATVGAESLMIRGTMSVLDPATRRPVDPDDVRRVLQTQHQVPAANIHVHAEGGSLLIDIGPFKTEERARAYLERMELDLARIQGADPFLRPRILPYSR